MIIVTGAKGQLGGDVCRILKEQNRNFLPVDINDLDITDKAAVRKFLKDKDFSSIIHCAAYTAVDKAEEEQEMCFKINAEGTENLAVMCNEKNAEMIYISTDYVFSGKGSKPFDTDSPKSPLSTYGKSKSDGEDAVIRHCKKYYIIRTSWVFGEENRNFIATMLRLAETRKEVRVVSDQIGSPTYSKDLAKLVADICQSGKYGIYHGTNEGFCSWYELAEKVFEIKGKNINVIPVTTEEYPTAAVRPKNSRLNKDSLDKNNLKRLPDWEDAVKRYLNNL